jgi:exopolysaccharide biosynthesis predicted pyruvyltransferase EpsI
MTSLRNHAQIFCAIRTLPRNAVEYATSIGELIEYYQSWIKGVEQGNALYRFDELVSNDAT